MRSRHVPRVCGHCNAPMARQENACWRCGTEWASEDVPRIAFEVLSVRAPEATLLETDRENTGALAAAAGSG
jgi:predicted amidophosphoribosyltransferase